jgi:hypothetical protein
MIPTAVDIQTWPVSRRSRFRQSVPFAVAAALIALLAIPFARVPFPFIDLYANLARADSLTWRATVPDAFSAGVEYRPMLTMATKVAYEVIGLDLGAYKAIVLLQVAGILSVLLWMFRPVGPTRPLAAAVALICFIGLHSSRILFNFNPLNAHSGVILIVLLTAAWALRPSARHWPWVLFPVTLVATLTLESGLLLIPVLGALWLVGAPGITTRGLMAATAGVVVYAAIHLTLGASVSAATAYTHSGLGFSAATPERLDATFGGWLWPFWLYNVLATIFTVAFSEPREGTYAFIAALTHGTAPTWMWLHVVSSVATTAVIAVAFPRGRLSPRDRELTAIGLALIVGGGLLGFLYTRDRIALPVGIGYVMLLYVALSALLATASACNARRTTAGLMLLLVPLWLVRDAETYWFLRDLAWEHHREWSVRYESIRDNRPETDLMRVLQALALEHTPADPNGSPPWTGLLLERKFGPPAN